MTRTPRPWRGAAPVAAARARLLAAACGSGPAPRSREDAIRSTATDVPFTGCDTVACTGRLAGAKYEIEMPAKWNGTLLLYSHGYRPAAAGAAGLRPGRRPSRPRTRRPTRSATALLAKGYALAGSAYTTNGWAVADGVAADEQLHDYFVEKVGKPDRTYVWGESLGGLITEILAEKDPDWVAGAAPAVRRARRPQPQLRPGAGRRVRGEDADRRRA